LKVLSIKPTAALVLALVACVSHASAASQRNDQSFSQQSYGQGSGDPMSFYGDDRRQPSWVDTVDPMPHGSVSVVPEPTSLALCLAGLGAVILMARRRKG
jgi:hypothetical protein